MGYLLPKKCLGPACAVRQPGPGVYFLYDPVHCCFARYDRGGTRRQLANTFSDFTPHIFFLHFTLHVASFMFCTFQFITGGFISAVRTFVATSFQLFPSFLMTFQYHLEQENLQRNTSHCYFVPHRLHKILPIAALYHGACARLVPVLLGPTPGPAQSSSQ